MPEIIAPDRETVPTRPRTRDRYADAVHARRDELRAQRALLLGGHRPELRAHLALSRLAGASATTLALAGLAAEASAHIDAGRAARDRLPELLTGALTALSAELHGRWSGDLAAALRLIARRRGLSMPSGWPRLPRPAAPPGVGHPPAGRRAAGAWLDGLAMWRLALLPPAALSLLGIPVAGGSAPGVPARALFPLACGMALFGMAAAVGARRAAVARAAWRAHVDSALALARATLEADLGRRVLELEQLAAAELDAAVERRRVAVDAELAGLAADRPAVPGA